MYTIVDPDSVTSYATVLADRNGTDLTQVDRAMILDLFKRHGAVLFRGFRLDLQSFETLTLHFCSRFVMNDSGRRQLVSKNRRTQTVNLGPEPFPLHPELSVVPWKPDIAWFGCKEAPERGGETLVCDGIAVAAALRHEVRAGLEGRSLLYKRWMPKELCQHMFGTIDPDAAQLQKVSRQTGLTFSREEEGFFHAHQAPVLHKPMFSARLAFGNFLLFSRFMHNTKAFPTFEDGSEVPDETCLEVKRVADRLQVAHRWQQGDLLMLDNTRFMHGRNAVDDVSQRLIWTQFGYASFAPLTAAERNAQPWRC